MARTSPPVKKAPWPPEARNDKFYRYPRPVPVGRKGETFVTVARDNSVDASDLVHYNFLTKNGEEINWYLANYVGCPEPKPTEKYYSFEGAVQDPKNNKGVIFIPMFGKAAGNYVNRLGDKVVENYNKSTRKEPGGRCYDACYARVKEASRQVGGFAVPSIDETTPFGRLWGSHIKDREAWLALPEEYRGKGAAGAMAYAGLGTLVDSDGIWAGKLEPGAVLQTWAVASDYDRVKDGKKPTSYGHSFLFLNYVYSGSSIAGLAMADQGFQNGDPLVKGDYAYWVAANLFVTAPAPVTSSPRRVYGPEP
jgi:hypothetical protein